MNNDFQAFGKQKRTGIGEKLQWKQLEFNLSEYEVI